MFILSRLITKIRLTPHNNKQRTLHKTMIQNIEKLQDSTYRRSRNTTHKHTTLLQPYGIIKCTSLHTIMENIRSQHSDTATGNDHYQACYTINTTTIDKVLVTYFYLNILILTIQPERKLTANQLYTKQALYMYLNTSYAQYRNYSIIHFN
jgi:hypothetical protein